MGFGLQIDGYSWVSGSSFGRWLTDQSVIAGSGFEAQDRLAETADGAAKPEGVGGLEVGEGEDAFFGVGEGLEEVATHDSGEDAGGEGRG